jgi:hypothetical protein
MGNILETKAFALFFKKTHEPEAINFLKQLIQSILGKKILKGLIVRKPVSRTGYH